MTANLVTSREVFLRVGDFIDGLSEDVDWCRRAVALGSSLRFDPELAVRHPTRQDWPSLRKKWMRTTREGYGIDGARRAAWFLKAALMPVSALVHVPKVLMSKKLAGTRERLAGLGTLFRLRFARGWWMLLLGLGRQIS